MKYGDFSKVTTEHMTVFYVGLHKYFCTFWQLRLYKELKHNCFYWILLQTFIKPFLCVVHISNRLNWEMWSQYLQYRMCFPFADTYGKETAAQQQMIIISVDFLPFLLPPSFWRHNVGVVKQSLTCLLSLASEKSWDLEKMLLN